jgi:hypothetical protein
LNFFIIKIKKQKRKKQKKEETKKGETMASKRTLEETNDETRTLEINYEATLPHEDEQNLIKAKADKLFTAIYEKTATQEQFNHVFNSLQRVYTYISDLDIAYLKLFFDVRDHYTWEKLRYEPQIREWKCSTPFYIANRLADVFAKCSDVKLSLRIKALMFAVFKSSAQSAFFKHFVSLCYDNDESYGRYCDLYLPPATFVDTMEELDEELLGQMDLWKHIFSHWSERECRAFGLDLTGIQPNSTRHPFAPLSDEELLPMNERVELLYEKLIVNSVGRYEPKCRIARVPPMVIKKLKTNDSDEINYVVLD